MRIYEAAVSQISALNLHYLKTPNDINIYNNIEPRVGLGLHDPMPWSNDT
jgi:hypothetical protein